MLITFSFIAAGGHSKFNLDSQTGWISVKSALDRDVEEVKVKSGVYTMVVKVKKFIVQVDLLLLLAEEY